MLDLKNIKKLFKYDWVDVFKNILPKDINGNLTKEQQKTLKLNSILCIVSSLLVVISVLFMTYNSITKDVLDLKLFDVVSFGRLLWIIIKCSIIPIGILIYSIMFASQEQNRWIVFSFFILIILWILYLLIENILCIRFISLALIPTLIGFIGFILGLFAGGNILTVLIDYSQVYNKQTLDAVKNYKGTIDSQIEQKICPKCGFLLNKTSEVCSMCGHKFQ